MRSRVVPCAASSLLAGLFEDSLRAPVELVEVARTRAAVHYDTGRDDVPVLCIATGAAVALPGSLVVCDLPADPVTVSDRRLRGGTTTWRVTRWWQPPRPVRLTPPDPTGPRRLASALPPAGVPRPTRDGALDPERLVGAGPGLTPSGDDLLAGALVTAHATGDPRLATWREETRAALRTRRTTAVSRGLLHHALDGYATEELAGLLVAVCRPGDPGPPLRRLLRVGHLSGAALAAGALHALSTHPAAGRSAA